MGGGGTLVISHECYQAQCVCMHVCTYVCVPVTCRGRWNIYVFVVMLIYDISTSTGTVAIGALKKKKYTYVCSSLMYVFVRVHVLYMHSTTFHARFRDLGVVPTCTPKLKQRTMSCNTIGKI